MITGFWTITDHCCRECFGRILMRADGPTAGSHRCSLCGADAVGPVEDLCCCGIQNRSTGANLRLRCVLNPKRSPLLPQEVAIARVPVEETAGLPLQLAAPLRMRS